MYVDDDTSLSFYSQALVRAGVQKLETKDESYAMENNGCTEGSVYIMAYDDPSSFKLDVSLWRTFFACLFTDVSKGAQNIEEGQSDTNTDLEGGSEKAEAGVIVTVGEVLTTRQLVVRRGLAVILMLAILAGGIVLNEMLTSFLKST